MSKANWWDRNSTMLITLVILILIWAAEIWLVQHYTLGWTYPTVFYKRVISAGWRLALDVSFLTFLIYYFSKYVSIVCAFTWLIFAQILLQHYSFFNRALSWTSISSQWKEGIIGAGQVIDNFINPTFFTFLALFIIKVFLIIKFKNNRSGNFKIAWPFKIAVTTVYPILVVFGVLVLDPLGGLERDGSVDRMGSTHGYFITWVAESYYLNQGKLTEEALGNQLITNNTVIDAVGQFGLKDVKNIVFLQVESLDWRVLGHVIDGQEITPFFRERLEDSIVARTEAIHINGSADTDFVWLTGFLPSSHVVTYKLRNYPYSDSLSVKARKAGFKSIFIHGNSGAFFDRRLAIDKMQFDKVLFSEELLENGVPASLTWGIDDDNILDVASRELNTNDKTILYLVTLTSHYPFTYVPEHKQTLDLPSSTDAELYLESINYTDYSISKFYDSLPDETLLIMFGDHEPNVAFTPFDINFNDTTKEEYVPIFIHLKGSKINDTMKIQIPDNLKMHAFATWMHEWLDNI